MYRSTFQYLPILWSFSEMSIRPCGCDNVRNVQYPGFTFYRGKITRGEDAGPIQNKINSAIFLGTGQPVDFYACRRKRLER